MVVILHTNDIHGHLTGWRGWEGDLKDRQIGGLDRLAGAISQVRKDHPDDLLLLDAGDLLGDTMIADLTKGEALLAVLNRLNYDAMTIGNHEPDFGGAVLRKRAGEAKFPFVAANLEEPPDGKLLLKPYLIRTVGGVQVGVLGLAYPETARTTAAKNVEDLKFTEPVAAVKRYLPKMREDGAEIALVLSHLGLGGDKQLAESVPDLDVIVGGHSHNRMTEALRVGRTLIVQAGAHGSDLGRLDLTVRDGKITAHKRSLIPLDHEDVPSDPDAAKLVQELLKPHREALDEVIGKAEGWLVRAQTLAGQEVRKRDEESPVDSLFADILRQLTKADLAFLPGVGYGVAIPPGPITAAQLRQLVPHEGKVVTMRLSGSRVVEVLEQAVENSFTDDPAVKVGGMVQVSGFRFRYDPAMARDHRIQDVERTEGRWNPSGDYTVVTNSLLAQGGHNYKAFLHGEKREEQESQYEVLKRWIRDNSPVTTPALGRIGKAKK
jgi:5'-nucleotidase